jgi:prevent-host-death family protein
VTRKLTATQAKAEILRLLDEVDAGDEIEITRHGRVIARLIPARGAVALCGKLAGMAKSNAAESDLLTTGEEWNLP